MNRNTVIACKNLTKTYYDNSSSSAVIRGLDLEIGKGELVAIYGKSGSGKSTLLNILTGIDRPSSGSVNVLKTELTDMTEKEMTRWRGRSLGIVFQFFQLIPVLTLLENVMLPLAFNQKGQKGEWKEKAEALLESVGLKEQISRTPTEVSGGEQQRAAIARALVTDPQVLFADEPTGNLDTANSQIIYEIFGKLCASGKTLVVATHEPSFTAWCSRIVVMQDGLISSPSGVAGVN